MRLRRLHALLLSQTALAIRTRVGNLHLAPALALGLRLPDPLNNLRD